MNDKFTVFLKNLLVGSFVMIASIGTSYLVSLYTSNTFGFMSILIAILVAGTLTHLFNNFSFRNYKEEHDHLANDLELKEILYDLLYKTSSYEEDEELYESIIDAAIKAVPLSDKGSILDVRNPSVVKYVAVRGFEKHVLDQMKLSLADTYLFKETYGAMDKTVVIKNSVNYNKLHSNDDKVDDLIAAGTAGIRSTICTPIRVMGEVMGMINLDSSKKNAFDEKDIHTIEIFALEVGKMIQFFEVMKENLYLSQYDSMTKIYNRGFFYELHHELYHRMPPQPYIFIATDLNNLKEVNDTFGHSTGDQLIVHYATTVRKYLDVNCIFGRYGGDEFNILMPGKTIEEAEEILQGISDDFAQKPLNNQGETIKVSFSYGMVRYPEDEKNYEALIILADQRMYEHKKRSKLEG